MTTATSKKLVYPSATRNFAPIADCLAKIMPDTGTIIEIASGSGQHITGFAAKFPDMIWCPSDPDAVARASIEAWRKGAALTNHLSPLDIDVTKDQWWLMAKSHIAKASDNMPPIKGLIATNMVHISPWEATLGLLVGAGALLEIGGFLYLYGPYKIERQHTAPSNEAFDISLRERNPSWGVRDRDEVSEAAAQHGLQLEQTVQMPANNFSLILRKMP